MTHSNRGIATKKTNKRHTKQSPKCKKTKQETTVIQPRSINWLVVGFCVFWFCCLCHLVWLACHYCSRSCGWSLYTVQPCRVCRQLGKQCNMCWANRKMSDLYNAEICRMDTKSARSGSIILNSCMNPRHVQHVPKQNKSQCRNSSH